MIEETLGDRGRTTGGGLGDKGGNVDFALFDDAGWKRVLAELVAPLVEEGVPLDAYFVLPDLPDRPRRTLLSLQPAAGA
ncbi:hypothetical protein [Dactylosporangium sp. NPDC000521]|uniref:hypothetical protein n=1 Tax=Dactylosporangium sp. NPDC000521 TaxID=3363975 RepID=UPI0036C5738C